MGDTPAVVKKDTTTNKKKTQVASSGGTQEFSREPSFADRAIATGKNLAVVPKQAMTVVDVSFPKDGAKVGIGKVKIGFKVKLIRNATSKTKVAGGSPLGVKSAIAITPLASDYNPILKKYSASLASISSTADFGFIKIGIGSDLLKVNEKGEITSTIKASGKATLDYNTFQAYKNNSPLLQPLKKYSNANSKFEIIIQLEWALTPADLRKIAELKKMAKNLDKTKDLAKKNIEDMKKAKAKFEQQERERVSKKNEKRKRKKAKKARKGKKGKVNNKKYKVKKWEDSKAFKKFQQKSKDLAEKAKGQVKKMSTLSKAIKSPLLKKMAVKILGKALVVVGVIDTLVSVTKIIKYWDYIKLQVPWGDGTSLDDAPLLGDLPKKGKEGEEGNLTNSTSSSDKTDGKVKSDGEGKSEENPSTPQDKSLDIKEKIKALATPIKELLEDMIDGEEGVKLKENDIEKIIDNIPKNLTEEEAKELRKMLISAENKELAELLASLIKAIKYIKGNKGKDIIEDDKSKDSLSKEDKAKESEEKTPLSSKTSDMDIHMSIVAKKVFRKNKEKYTVLSSEVKKMSKQEFIFNGIKFRILEVTARVKDLISSKESQMLRWSLKLEVLEVLIKEETTYKVGEILERKKQYMWNITKKTLTPLEFFNPSKFLSFEKGTVTLLSGVSGKLHTVLNMKGNIKLKTTGNFYSLIFIPIESGGFVIKNGKKIEAKKGKEIILHSDEIPKK